MASVADDNISSVQFASILDYISEGEIDGIEGGDKGVYYNKTPLESSDGTRNFLNVTTATRNGTQGQTYIPSTNGVESEKSVGIEITNSTPVVRTITDSEVDRVRLTLQIPSLQKRHEDTGNITGYSVQVSIDIQYAGGSYTDNVISTVIHGKTSSKYQRDWILSLNGAFPVNIRFRRASPDDQSLDSSKTFWSSYTEIIDEKFRYPNSALIHHRLDARQFNQLPARRFLVRGIKVKIPSNATVDTSGHIGRITYSGVWDGTFKSSREWTNDPAWCLYDLLINTRFGCSIPEATLDRWDFYSVSQYCNELVSNGKGGQEPRFSLNVHITDRKQIYSVIKELTAVFRGISYFGAGSFVILQDRPADSQYLIGPSNVIDGDFFYEGSSVKARHTTCTVSWQSYDDLGEVRFELIEDRDGIDKYGVINKDVKAVGCYSQGQAHRLGKWLLLSERWATETCSFSVSVDSGLILRPGMLIDIADPLKTNSRRSGRIKSATVSSVTLDLNSDLSVDLNNSPTISVVMPDGLVETRDISSTSNIASGVVDVDTAFSQAPNNQGVWLIQTSDVQSQQFRIVSVTEKEEGTLAVVAVIYNSTLYSAVESDLNVTQRDITNLTDPPDAIGSLSSTEFLYQSGNSVLVGAEVSWVSPVKRVSQFKGKYRIDNDNWTEFVTTNPSITLRSLRAGTLYVEVKALNYIGKESVASTADFTLAGKTAPPAAVSNLTFEPISNNSGRLRWDKATDLDVLVGGSVEIRHSSLTDGSGTWSNSVTLIPSKTGIATEAIVPLIEGEILVKFKDSSGYVSSTATSVLVDLPDTIQPITILSQREDQISPTPFAGSKTNCVYDATQGGLVLETEGFDGVASVDAVADFDAIDYGDVESSGTYLFESALDLGAVYSLDLVRHFATVGYLPDDDLDARAALVDSYSDWDGAVNNVDAKLYVRKTTDDPASGSASWGAWQEFANGTFRARGYEFKATLTSSDTDENIKVTQLGYGASFKRRTEQSVGAVASGAGAKTITFSKPFFVGLAGLGGVNAYLPSIGLQVNNLATGDYIDGPAVTGTSFTFTVKNSSGAAIDKSFTWSAVGYGLGV